MNNDKDNKLIQGLLKRSQDEIDRGDYVTWNRSVYDVFIEETILTFCGITIKRRIPNADHAPPSWESYEDYEKD